MKHKHCESIKAWADGKQIQGALIANGWVDLAAPTWSVGTEYRIKPETLRYRVALFSGSVLFTTKPENEKSIERSPSFIRWLTDWQEVEV